MNTLGPIVRGARLPNLGNLLWLIPALLMIGTWLLFLTNRAPHTAAALTGFPLDDAWIHMVYGRALAFEGCFNYNPGIPETGMTSPLWAVLVAGVHLTLHGQNIGVLVIGTKVLALLCGIVGAWLLMALSRALGLGVKASLLAALLFAVDPSLTFSRAAGMEVPLFTALILLALLMAARGRVVSTGAAIGVAIVARPEGAMLLPILAVMLVGNPAARSQGAWRFALAGLLSVLPGLLEVAYCLHATGAPLPNTYYVKFVRHPLSWKSLSHVWHDKVTANLPYFTLGIGSWLALLGAWAMVRRAPRDAGGVLGAGFLLFFGTMTTRIISRGHFHYWERWFIPAFPILLLAIAAGMEEIWTGLPSLRGRRAGSTLTGPIERRGVRLLRFAASGIALLVLFLPWSTALVNRAEEYAWNCQNIEELNVATGRWVGAHLPPDAVVATCDAGAVRYFGDRVTVDLIGLNDQRMRAVRVRDEGLAVLKSSHVGWMILFPGVCAEWVGGAGLEPVFAVRSLRYTIGPIPGQAVLVTYRWDQGPR